MSRIANPSEKVLAVAKTFISLKQELHGHLAIGDPGVQMSLIDAATRIAMGTDTRDLGILGATDPGDHFARPCPLLLRHPDAPDQPCVLIEGHGGPHLWTATCDDCGRTDGTHDPDVEH